jgi:hypothetical protein
LGPQGKKLQGKRGLSTQQTWDKYAKRRERVCVCVCVRARVSLSSALILDSINPREKVWIHPPEKNFLNLSSTVEHSLSIGEEFFLFSNLRQPTRESIKSEKNFLTCSSQMIDDVITRVEQVIYIYIYIYWYP